MGRSHSKIKFTSDPLEKQEYNFKRKQKELEKRKKRHEKVQKALRKGKKFKQTNDGVTQKKVDLKIFEYDEIATKRLRNQLDTDFSAFILNQLILSIQFYGNFEREKSSAIERNLNRETERNRYLEKHSIILPNVMDDMVERRLYFKAKHGSYKNEIASLQIQTMYVIHENIEILKPEETNYASISPTCKVVLDTLNLGSINWKGYVRLKLWEILKKKEDSEKDRKKDRKKKFTKSNARSCQVESSTDNTSSDNDSVDQFSEQLNKSRSSTSTLNNPSSSEYDYAYINNLNTHRPLSQLTAIINDSSLDITNMGLLNSCITGLPTYLDCRTSESEEFYSDTGTEKLKYLNSKAFLCYFANVFKDKLASDLGISNKELETATYRGASIFTSNYEIIPAIFCPWPSCAFEWQRRHRPVHENPINGQRFQWPNQAMVHRIVSFGCHVIPLGYAPKRGKNAFRELEWKIVFPKAERYLESCLTSTQVKILMITKALIKTFVEPQHRKTTYMFSFDHLRAHLFWQCENNYAAWPEEYLGEVLIRFLTSFLERISIKRLPDYFLRERNLFENIPEKAKADLHQIISQIIQNPVMHIMLAYRNIHQIENFCPKLKYKELYSIIVINNPIKVLNRSSKTIGSNKLLENVFDSNLRSDDDSEDETDSLEGLIGYSQKKEKYDETKRRRTKKLKRKERVKIRKKLEQESARKLSMDSIDIQFLVPPTIGKIKRPPTKPHIRKTLDDVRRSFILEFFVNFFISSAKNSLCYHSLDQSLLYLNQASKLCILLGEYHYQDVVKKYNASIEEIRCAVQAAMQYEIESGPALPRRISLEPVKSFQYSKSRGEKIDPYTNIDTIVENHETFKETKGTLSVPNARKSVQFTELSFIEPRNFLSNVQVHSPPTGAKEIKTNPRLNGIMKQCSLEESHLNIWPSQVETIKTKMNMTSNNNSENEAYGDTTEL